MYARTRAIYTEEKNARASEKRGTTRVARFAAASRLKDNLLRARGLGSSRSHRSRSSLTSSRLSAEARAQRGWNYPPPYRNRDARSARRATSQEEKRATGAKDPEEEEEEIGEGEDEDIEGATKSRQEKENKIGRATHRNPNRVMSTSLFLDGSREPSSTGLKHEHRTDRPVTKYRAEPGTERTDGVCRPSHPGRALNGLRVEGRKEGGGGGRAEPRQR